MSKIDQAMKSRTAIVLLLLASSAMSGAQTKPRPRFEDYPVKDIYRGKPAAPVLKTRNQRLFRTMIREGANSKVQFAGHYTVAIWGCGSGCGEFALVDSITGRVYDGFTVEDPTMQLAEQRPDLYPKERIEFRPNSDLLKINGCPNERNCGSYDFVMMDGKGLTLVRKELLPKQFQY